ncbi:DUF6624 domain-containing protein [uncultured Algimonas sp.]|uniref:DUF6624 domain-containing protein n=1 Tax=uncultured Algimonas sp. TaxID=1547920 RepID=UPI00260E1AE9|nr:DUF6624 domain-containing protein [uncultured Algimonas sp.]
MTRFLLTLLCVFVVPMGVSAQSDVGDRRITQAKDHPADNAEIAALFEADQAVRQGFTPEKAKDPAFIKAMIDGDRERRERTLALLAEDALRTDNDFYHAAFIFQHGGTADDYLLAHSLAVAAVAKGHESAAWISAATLDRYLMNIGQPQVYGTQYTREDGKVTMDPYDRDLVPDALRTALGVPTLTEQTEKLDQMRAPG